MATNIYEILEKEISASELSDSEKNKRLAKLLKARGQKINIMLVGATGSGKSSTINSLFNTSVAKVGVGVDPETEDISCYELENLIIWDSPGLGDTNANDANYSSQILKKLSETDENGVPVVDLVLVVIDSSTKDLRTTCELINDILLPALTKENAGRILVALNQADMAMKGNHWLKEENCPDDTLKAFLEEKCAAVGKRIFEETGIEFNTMYYCAGYTDENGNQMPAYNLTKLLYNILLSVPAEKRIAIAENLNDNGEMWEYDDGDEDYISGISESFGEIFWDSVGEFAEKGVVYGGAILGMPGALVGTVIGGVAGAIKGVFKGLFS